MKPKISIIVPIYNMEQYLSRCLDSLLEQELKDFEIVTINDGSTDNSLQIIQSYADKDKRITIINKDNQGVSAARNEGIEIAKGDYIGFVDPDDWIDPRMYKEMLQIAEKGQIDIVMCSYFREFGAHSKEKTYDLPNLTFFYNNDVKNYLTRRLVGPLKREISNPELLDAWGTVWSKLYKAELIKRNTIHFIDLSEIGSNEDTLFNIQASYYANSFVFLNKPYYHYWRANDTSITTKYKPKLVKQFGYLYTRIENFLNEKNLGENYKIALRNRISLNAIGLGLNIVNSKNALTFDKRLKEVKKLLNNTMMTNSLQNFELLYCSFVWRIFFLSAKSRATLLFYVLLETIEFARKRLK